MVAHGEKSGIVGCADKEEILQLVSIFLCYLTLLQEFVSVLL